ncbi:hypothetical protein C8F01DRAFT_1260428 [Mycena amicta]|nr:hypothetical protein C8F01DRAFT_1260428 [Mycena amicta]
MLGASATMSEIHASTTTFFPAWKLHPHGVWRYIPAALDNSVQTPPSERGGSKAGKSGTGEDDENADEKGSRGDDEGYDEDVDVDPERSRSTTRTKQVVAASSDNTSPFLRPVSPSPPPPSLELPKYRKVFLRPELETRHTQTNPSFSASTTEVDRTSSASASGLGGQWLESSEDDEDADLVGTLDVDVDVSHAQCARSDSGSGSGGDRNVQRSNMDGYADGRR